MNKYEVTREVVTKHIFIVSADTAEQARFKVMVGPLEHVRLKGGVQTLDPLTTDLITGLSQVW